MTEPLARQADRIQERRSASSTVVTVCGLEFAVHPGVYRTGVDTELMVDAVLTAAGGTLLEVGCGCGAFAICVCHAFTRVIAVDVNEAAVANTSANIRSHEAKNVEVRTSDVFDAVLGQFDVLVFNPPYSNWRAVDSVERMFWDPNNEAKIRFFAGARRYASQDGRIFFGWSDFTGLDQMWPITTASTYGLQLVQTWRRLGRAASHAYLVHEFAVTPV